MEKNKRIRDYETYIMRAREITKRGHLIVSIPKNVRLILGIKENDFVRVMIRKCTLDEID